MRTAKATKCRYCHKRETAIGDLCISCHDAIKYGSVTYHLESEGFRSNASMLATTERQYEGFLPQWET